MTPHEEEYGFVQLNRTFQEFRRHARESDEADLARAFFVGAQLTWSDVLRSYRTIVLSEAGSGKTEEIRQIASRLRHENKIAFFLRLEHLAVDLEDAFEVGS